MTLNICLQRVCRAEFRIVWSWHYQILQHFSSPPLLFSGVMWMSKLTSLPALLLKNHDRPTGRRLLAFHQPFNEFTGCVLGQLCISVRPSLWYFPKVENLDASGESLGRFCFASRATCWKHQWKTYISPPCWLIHLSIPHNSAESEELFSTSMWCVEAWILKNVSANCQFSLCYSSLVVYATVAECIKY